MSKTVSPAAADALRAATADETSVTLAPGQLDRPVYVEVNKVLERIAGGGKWNRKAKAHLFTQDPRPALAELIGAGDDMAMPDDEAKLASFWRTPPRVASTMTNRLSHLPDLATVLEPSAGDGAIADKVPERFCLQCVEANEERAGQLAAAGYTVRCERFQDYASRTRQRFDAVVMNPPFTEVGNATAWVEHIDLAWSLLRPGGTLLAIAPVSYEQSSRRKIVEFRDRFETADGDWQLLPDDAFKESGTGVRTGLLSMVRAEGRQ